VKARLEFYSAGFLSLEKSA